MKRVEELSEKEKLTLIELKKNRNYSVLREALYLGVLRSSNTKFLTKKAQKKPIFRVLGLLKARKIGILDS
jgi:hypothetical protein